MKEKKKKMIDLVLEGALSKEDMSEQVEWYDAQIQELENKLLAYCGKNRQTAETEAYIAVLDDILSFDEENQELYREILEKMVITNNVVDVYLKSLPFAARFTIRSFGRNENYVTDILAMELLSVQ